MEQVANNYKVAAVLITFNRLEFLKEIVQALKSQTRKIDEIFVIHNSGTDGTAEWLAEQEGLTVITQPNTGSSGGQYTGFKAAYEAGYDWIWTMDDDVVPAANTLEQLLIGFDSSQQEYHNTIRTPLRLMPNGKPYLNDCLEFNLSNPFKGIWKRILSTKDLNQKFIPAAGITFEGPIFHRSIVEKIGFPDKNFFIFADDTEYMVRAIKAGAKAYIYTNAKFQRKLDYTEPTEFGWKHKYIIRNIIAVDVMHGTFAVRLLRPFRDLLKWSLRSKSLADLKTTFQAFAAGYFYKQEN